MISMKEVIELKKTWEQNLNDARNELEMLDYVAQFYELLGHSVMLECGNYTIKGDYEIRGVVYDYGRYGCYISPKKVYIPYSEINVVHVIN